MFTLLQTSLHQKARPLLTLLFPGWWVGYFLWHYPKLLLEFRFLLILYKLDMTAQKRITLRYAMDIQKEKCIISPVIHGFLHISCLTFLFYNYLSFIHLLIHNCPLAAPSLHRISSYQRHHCSLHGQI